MVPGEQAEDAHFQDCDVLIFREWIGDVATVLIETKVVGNTTKERRVNDA